MDQQKIGAHLRQLRLQKNLTQEQLAEQFHTTNRSVSRWETGKSLPDISLLIELADFYEVDIREILDGENTASVAANSTKDVATKVADYADATNSKLLRFIRLISFIGIIVSIILVAIQTMTYEPSVTSFLSYFMYLLIFMIMVIIHSYTTGNLAKIAGNKSLILACKVLVITSSLAVFFFMVRALLILAIILVFESTPPQVHQGIAHYDKTYYLETYGNDLDTGMFIFPDSTDNMLHSVFDSNLHTGLFDTDGYIILSAEYPAEAYAAEMTRIKDIECSITHGDTTVTQEIRYDESTYALPAYITSDGFGHVYEYALMDEENHTITYVLLCYPNPDELADYSRYLKIDTDAYNIESAVHQFTIYAHSFDGGNSWLEYSDMVN
ncbi:MAG: helix-turn-helix transcriptional regulator [Lachnospiraceae bacterium]|nr:helix-turn-helix transcriptional regulator [Lachnospiraceae bacterium]